MDEDEEEMIPIKSDKDGARNKIEDFGNVIVILIFILILTYFLDFKRIFIFYGKTLVWLSICTKKKG